jgi:hypothetical protein
MVGSKKSADRDRVRCRHTCDGVTALFIAPTYTLSWLLFASTAKISTLQRVRTPLTKGNLTPHHTVYRSAEITPQ